VVRRDGAEARRERIEKIAKAVHSALEAGSGEIPLGKTVSLIAVQTGLTRTRIMEYLTILADADHFSLDTEDDKVRKTAFSER
jgi:hypothetical protein